MRHLPSTIGRMRRASLSLFTHLLWLGTLPPSARAEISAGAPFDLQAYVDQKIAAGEHHITLPPGRHRMSPAANNGHLTIWNQHDLTIDGTGAELICTSPTRGVNIGLSSNIRLIGLTVDYDPLPFTQGRITGMSADKLTLQVELMQGYPASDTLSGGMVEIYDDATGKLATTTYYGATLTPNGQNVNVTKPSSYGSVSMEEIGDIVVLKSVPPGASTIPHAFFIYQSTDVVLENITLYASNSFGFLENYCSATRYLNCVIDRRPLDDDLKVREYPRMRSLAADGFHSKFATVGPSYIGCTARHNGDDGIAINGDYHVVMASDGANLRVVGKFGNEPELSVGDVVELVTYSGERLEDAQITAISPDAAVTPAETQFLVDRAFSGNVAATAGATNAYQITLGRSVSLPMGSLIASASRVGNGFEVRNCTIGPNRARGILVKSSDGIISGNTVEDTWLEGILMAPSYKWLEAGSGSNITVSNNTIRRCRDAAIAIVAEGGDGSTAPAGAHNQVAVVGNRISDSANPAIAVTSSRGLKLYNNNVSTPDTGLVIPWKANSYGRPEDPGREIYQFNNEQVSTTPPATLLEAWRDSHHIKSDGSDDMVDFSGDGIPALFNFAFNLGDPRDRRLTNRHLLPATAEAGGLPVVTVSDRVHFRYLQLGGANTGITYHCEYNPGLESGNWTPIQSTPAVYESITNTPVAGSDYEEVSVRLTEPLENRGFFRVSITEP